MELSITGAIEELAIIKRDYDLVLTKSQLSALNYAQSALKTIEDGNFILKPKQQPHPQIELKTLYEQTTQYCTLVDTDDTASYYIEIFHQSETPIYIFVYWNREPRTIHSIAYTIKGE